MLCNRSESWRTSGCSVCGVVCYLRGSCSTSRCSLVWPGRECVPPTFTDIALQIVSPEVQSRLLNMVLDGVQELVRAQDGGAVCVVMVVCERCYVWERARARWCTASSHAFAPLDNTRTHFPIACSPGPAA